MRRTKGYYNGKPIYSLYVNKKNIIKPFGDTDFQAMFNNGEQGFFYNPSDITTLYQDSTGISKVTNTGQPVGLLLDKSKGIELKPFNYTAQLSIAGTGIAEIREDSYFYIERGNPGNAGAINIPTKINKYFRLDIEVVSGAAISIRIGPGTNIKTLSVAEGRVTLIINMQSFDYLRFVNVVDNTNSIFKIHSLSEFLGNHSYQLSSAARPILRQKPILGGDLVAPLDFNIGWKNLPASTTTNPTSNSFTVIETGGVSLTLPLDINKLYQVTLNYTTSNPSAVVQILSGVSGAGTVVSTGTSVTRSIIMSGGNSSGYYGIYLRVLSPTSSTTITVNLISLREITGYLQNKNYTEYDSIDDKLITNFPTETSNCNIFRSIPGKGTQVKYNQTIPQLYEDSTNHSGLLAINRNLTRREQTILMEEFDRRAGATSLETLAFKTFDNNQEGFVYDPNDLNTMFQDAIGVTPVTAAGQPVGLLLDKSKGLRLAENLISFPKSESLPASVSLGDAVATWSLNTTSPISGTVDSRLVVSTQSTVSFRPLLAFNLKSPLTAGKLYKMSFKYKVNSGSPKIVAVYNGSATTSIPNSKGILVGEGVFETYIRWQVGDQTRPYIYFSNESVFDIQMNDFSCAEVLGNYAYQATSASRPILRQNAITGANYLEFDGIDDYLETSDIPSLNESTVISGTRLRRTTGTHPIVSKGTGGYPYLSGSMFYVQLSGDAFRIANNPNGDTQLAQYRLDGSTYIETQRGVLSSGTTGNGLKIAGKFFIARFNATTTTAIAAFDLYGLVVIGKVLPVNQYKEVTNYLKNKMGI